MEGGGGRQGGERQLRGAGTRRRLAAARDGGTARGTVHYNTKQSQGERGPAREADPCWKDGTSGGTCSRRWPDGSLLS